MKPETFSLQPFPATAPLPPLQITGSIARFNNQLAIRYTLHDQRSEVVIAAPADEPTRKHNLWEDTCFEFFLGPKSSARYWEFNLSPAGDWNIYRFDTYRQGMQVETAITALPFSIQTQADTLALALDLDLTPLVSAEQELEVAITAVVKLSSGEVMYWALTHQGPEADFHRRDSFICQL